MVSVQSGSIEAVLTLDATRFNQGINQVTAAIDRLVASAGKVTKLGTAFDKITKSLMNFPSANKINSLAPAFTALVNQVGKFDAEIGKVTNNFNRFSNILQRTKNSLLKFPDSQGLTNFSSTLSTVTQRLSEFQSKAGTAVNSFNKFVNAFNRLNNSLNTTSSSISRVNTSLSTLGANTSLAGLSGISTTLGQVNSKSYQTYAEITRLKGALASLATTAITPVNTGLNTVNNTQSKVNTTMTAANNVMTNYKNNSQQLNNTVNSVNNGLNQTSNNMGRVASQSRTAQSAVSGLSSSFSMLHSVASMVASLFVFQLANGIYEMTRESISARSEMETLFDTLSMSGDEIETFNAGLDRTIERFQKMSRYNLGETVASLGVEFELTTEEMVDAMEVVGMVQSEYVRAGRSVDEATLAVKDVLQGEFVRLSRETGVGKGELMDYGWSGDNRDIDSLLTALEKIGYSRHWDVFAAKAESLNDILTITENRFAEFTTDLVSYVTPGIVSAFNNIVSILGVVESVIGTFSEGFTMIFGDAGVQAANIGLLVTAITGAAVALVHYRTGANLVQMVQMGLRGSITATIFALDAESVAQYGSLKALTAKITGYQAETVAAIGSKNAILAKILGLKEEALAQGGLRGALLSSIAANQQEAASKRLSDAASKAKIGSLTAETGATTTNTGAKAENTAATVSNTGANELNSGALSMNTTVQGAKTAAVEADTVATLTNRQAILTHILSLDAEIVANNGVIAAMAAKAVESSFLSGVLNAQTVATYGTATATGVLTAALIASPLGIIIGVVAGAAAAFWQLTEATRNAASRMSEFNEIVENGDAVVQDYYDNLAYFRNRQQELQEELDNTSKSSSDYKKILEELEEATRDTEQAQKDLQLAIHGVNQAQNMSQWTEDEKMRNATKTNAKLAEQMEAQGYSPDQIKSVNSMYSTAQYGVRELYEATQVWNHQSEDFLANQKTLDAQLKKGGMSLQERKGWTDDLTEAYGDLQEASYTANTSDDFWERLGGQWNAGWAQMKIDWINFWADPWSGIEGFFSNSEGLIDKLFNTDYGGMLSGWFNDNIVKPVSDAWNGFVSDPLGSIGSALNIGGFFDALFGEGAGDVFGEAWDYVNTNIVQPFTQAIWKFIQDPMGTISEGLDILGMVLNSLFGGGEEGDNTTVMGFVQNKIILPFVQGLQAFINDPIGFIGDAAFSLGGLLSSLFTMGGEDPFTMMLNWMNTSIFQPIGLAFQQFMADPVSFLGGMVLTLDSLLNSLFGGGEGGSAILTVTNWINMNIVQPFIFAITNLPNQLIGAFNQFWLGLTGQEGNANSSGYKLGKAIGDGIEWAIGQIPIIGDILRLLGLIDSQQGNANSSGNKLGSNVDQGWMSGMGNLVSNVTAEINDAINAISNAAGKAYDAAKWVGESIWNGMNSILQRHSPGFIHDEVKAEFQDVATAITDESNNIYTAASIAGQAMVDGVQSKSSNVTTTADNISMVSAMGTPIMPTAPGAVDGMDPTVNQDAMAQYQMDAQTANMINTDTAMSTQMTFAGLGSIVNGTFSSIGSNMVTTYTNMNSNQKSMLNTMQKTNTSSFKTIQTQTTSSLNNMRSSTQSVTNQMTNAWILMKDNIVNAANNLRSQSTAHFNRLSNTIGTFYRKIQNPSNWGAGAPGYTRGANNPGRYRSGVKAVNSIFGQAVSSGAGAPSRSYGSTRHGAGFSDYDDIPEYMSLRKLLKVICPSGQCLSGYTIDELNQKVNVMEFLGKLPGGFGWGDWSGRHHQYIKSTSGRWSMASPQLLGYIDSNADFKVRDFENGAPKITWGSFMNMAEALFSHIGYDLYWDSEKCGNWVDALRTGSVNCSDGTDALLALARTCGFSGSKVHGYWGSMGHYYAIINGKVMDTTNYQKNRSWSSPAAGAPSAFHGRSKQAPVNETTNVNVTVDLSNSNIYGIDDLDSKINDGVNRGLQEAINVSPITGV